MRLRMRSFILFILLAMPLTASCSSAPLRPDIIPQGDYEYTKQYISWMIQKEMKRHQVKGLSIALIDDQKTIWEAGFGLADAAKEIPATPKTVYRVASISKLFTVTAVMQLAEQGKIDIDEALQTYIPEFSMKTRFKNTDPITPRTLMTHHSGLPADWGKEKWSRNPAQLSDVVTQIRDEYVAYPPNTILSYSNLGMTVLGHLVERVSRKDFVSYTDERVLATLGMTHSAFVLKPDIKSLLAKGYFGNTETEDLNIRDLPAGALYSNVIDLGRFIRMIFGNGQSGNDQLLRSETIAEMLRPQNTGIPLDFDRRIGLGWWLTKPQNTEIGTLAEHAGDMIFFHSDLIILPQHKLGVVVLSNSRSARKIVHSIAMETIKLALESKRGLVLSAPEKAIQAPSTPPSHDQLKAYEGRYMTWAGPVSVNLKGETLSGRTRDETVNLVPRAKGWFGVRYYRFGIFPVHWGDREISLVSVDGRSVVVLRDPGGRRYFFGEKIEPKPIPDIWLNRLGKLKVLNQEKDLLTFEEIVLRHEENLLIIEAKLKIPATPEFEDKIHLVFSPISDTEGIILGPGMGMGETVRIVNVDGQERFRYSGYEAVRIE